MSDHRGGTDTSTSDSTLSSQTDLNPQPHSSLSSPSLEAQQLLNQLVHDGLVELAQRRQALVQEVEQLEQQRDRLQAEMRTNFAGVSQDVAVRVQSFKEYLVGSLQDLTTAAEQLPLKVPEPRDVSEPPRSVPQRSPQASVSTGSQTNDRRGQPRLSQPLNLQPATRDKQLVQRSSHPRLPQPPSQVPDSRTGEPASPLSTGLQTMPTKDISVVAHQMLGENAKQIRQILDQYRQSPNYYGAPWQLRRTFEPIHADRVSQWFFEHGGRGSLKTLGSRLQNILVTSAIISVLRVMHGDRLHTLILSDSPERLGDWRRGLQDCLGISRADFGGQQGVALFEAPEALTQRVERLIQQGRLPLILIDNSTDMVHLSMLQYPLWLAFAPDLNAMPLY
ncbi:MAG: DUF3086 domain-containing protein [Cyanothece sp. SIO2G6]|nr:DUF3086 domain-containing protein [Cyanothece sp. SIO2G6]